MTAVVQVLAAAAKDLARQAEDSMPKLVEGEVIIREQYNNGIYYRETTISGKNTVFLYDFRQKECRLLATEGVIE